MVAKMSHTHTSQPYSAADFELYRDLVEMSQDLIWQCDTDGRYNYLNPAWEQTLGYPLNELLGKRFSDFQPPEYASRDLAEFKKLLAGDTLCGLHTIHIAKDGSFRYLIFQAKHALDAQGHIVGIRGTAHDNTDRHLAEFALKETESKFRALFEKGPIGVAFHEMVYDETGKPIDYRFLDSNQSYQDLTGVAPGRRLVTEAFPGIEKDPFDWIGTFGRVAQTGEEIRFEQYLAANNRWYDCVGYQYQPDHFVAAFIEITHRKQAEAELRDTQSILAEFVKNSPIYAFIKDVSPTESRVLMASDNYQNMIGISGSAMKGKSMGELFPPGLAASITQDDWQVASNGTILSVDEDLNGRHYTSIKFPIHRSNKVLLAGYTIDITERVQAEEKLRESESKLSALFTAMTEVVILNELVFDPHGIAINYRIKDCNRAFTLATGIPKDQVIGKLATEVYAMDTPPHLDELARVAATGVPYEYTDHIEHADKYFTVSVVATLPNQFATIATDVSGIHQIQEALHAKNKELENYLYVASHDLRSPLINILGFSQRLQSQFQEIQQWFATLPQDQSPQPSIEELIHVAVPKSFKFILSSVQKMDYLINGLLQISRTGRMEMNIETVDMDRLMDSVIGAHSFQIAEAEATIACSPLACCNGDQNQLNQLFSNLLGNAIKYRDKQRPLHIRIYSAEEPNWVRYAIQDNGIGIDSRHLEKIWDIFYRVDPSQSETGDGLGLSIIKRIADKHRGKVWVESKVGIGSTFYVELQKSPPCTGEGTRNIWKS